MSEIIDIDNINNDYYRKTMWNLKTLESNFDLIELDLSFQRRGAWTEKEENEYVLSMLKGRAFTNICVADIEECLLTSIERKDEESIIYYEELIKKGQKYISIDGNNRSKTIKKLLRNEITFPKMHIEGSDGESINLEGMTFKELQEKDKIAANEITKKFKLSITILESSSKEELHDSFLRINDAVSLKHQEMRNAIDSKVSEEIRRLSKKYSEKLKKLITEDKYDQRYDEEIIVSLLLLENNGKFTPINKDNLDKLYSEDAEESIKKLEKKLDILFEKIKGVYPKKLYVSMTINEYIYISLLESKKIEILNYDNIHEFFMNFENKMRKTLKNGERSEYSELNRNQYQKQLMYRYEKIDELITKELKNKNSLLFKSVKINNEDDINNQWESDKKLLPQKTKDQIKEENEIIDLNETSLDSFYKRETINLNSIKKLNNNTKLDYKFQRRYAWKNKNRNQFIKSLLMGRVFSEITLIDIKSAKDNAENKDTKEYYTKLMKEGHKFISIDGNNRTQTMVMLMNNEITFPDIKIKVNGKSISLKGKKYQDLKETPELMKIYDYINNIEVNVSYITKSELKDIPKTFVNVNKGVKVNDQEELNAIIGDTSEFIRKISNKHKDFFKQIIDEKDYIRRSDEEYLSIFLHIENNYNDKKIINGNKKMLIKMFQNNLKNEVYKKMEQNMEQLSKIINQSNKKNHKSFILNSYLSIKILYEKGYEIKDFRRFQKNFEQQEEQRRKIKIKTEDKSSKTGYKEKFPYQELSRNKEQKLTERMEWIEKDMDKVLKKYIEKGYIVKLGESPNKEFNINSNKINNSFVENDETISFD